jgi:hypothetical protein
MPNYKNSFKAPDHFETTILDEKGNTIGTIRLKPSSILWKPKRQHKFYTVDLDTFDKWITAKATQADRTKS